MKSARTLGGRQRLAFFAWTVGAAAAAACLPVDRPEKVADAVESAEDDGAGGASGAGSTVVAPSPTAREQSSGETPPVIGAAEPNTVSSQAAAGCSGDAGSCSSLGDAGVGPSCTGCSIEGACVATDAIDPANPCQICDPQRSAQDWSPQDGVGCDDGLFCTTDDACQAGLCRGEERICEDGVACNGVSTCDETAAKCTDDVNQCGTNALCNAQTDSCVSTCPGCIINGVCLTIGTEASGNPCLVCDPTRSTTSYTAAAGKSCGAGPTACSQQDSCDGQGRCQPNHLAVNAPCGNTASGPCDQPDSCDGNGTCQQRVAGNGTGCDDGAFCTVGDQCQGGQCVPTGNQNCGANRTCNEAANQCQCQGCQIGNTCFSAGAVNPANSCQICDLSRSATTFSVRANASCGAGQICNAQAQCVPEPLAEGATCTNDGDCASNRCGRWFRDRDGDRFGDPATQLRTCLGVSGTGTAPDGYVAQGQDCCDLEGGGRATATLIHPGQTQVFTSAQIFCGNVGAFDYDCSGAPEASLPEVSEQDCINSFPNCESGVPVGTACGATYQPRNCFLTDDRSACFLQLFGGPNVGPLGCH